MFYELALEEPAFYGAVVMVIGLSIVLHELGHAYAAGWQGDSTPAERGHLTLNPMVHLGPMSLGMLLLFGIAWGACPIDPRQFRDGARGEAAVALAGPAVNVVLALLLAGVVMAVAVIDGDARVARVAFYAGGLNMALALFNLMPVPPLDGFVIAEALVLSEHWARTAREAGMGLFLIAFLAASTIFDWGFSLFSGLVALGTAAL